MSYMALRKPSLCKWGIVLWGYLAGDIIGRERVLEIGSVGGVGFIYQAQHSSCGAGYSDMCFVLTGCSGYVAGLGYIRIC